MTPALLNKIQRGLHKPPKVIARRLVLEARRSWDRLRVRVSDCGTAPGTLLAATEAGSIAELWSRLAARHYFTSPAGEAYLLTGHERYAAAVRECLEQWMDENPCMVGVNWACTMEVALRIFSWTWFFHVFQAAASWAADRFRTRLLCQLFTHARFT